MPPDRSGGFGSRLKAARERRGTSLHQIANATKIPVASLEALERDDVARLPGGIFSRAFVRSYAVEVGLDPEATILEFIASFPPDAVSAGHPTAGQVEDHQAIDSERRSAATFLSLAALSVPIAGFVLYLATTGGVSRTADRPVETAPAAAAAPASVPPPSAPPAAVAATGGVADSKGAAAGVAATVGEAVLTVGLSASRPCWVLVVADGKRQIEELMQAGQSRVVEVRRDMSLTAGDASALALTFNGAAGRPLGKAGQVVTARFNLTNYKTYLQTR